jgi:hypothetical protein
MYLHTLARNLVPTALILAAMCICGRQVSAADHETKTKAESATERFRTFLDAKLLKEMRDLGITTGKPDYRIVTTDDLNSDGVPDYIVFDKSPGACGSGGCPYEIYVTKRNEYEEIDAAELFGKSSVFVRQSHEAWKEIFTSDGGSLSSYPVYHRNVYDTVKKSYVEVESWFCGGLDFDACTAPVLFCSIDGSELDVRETGHVYRAPYDEPVTLAGVGGNLASLPTPVPREFGYFSGQTTDGKWFMVIYKFSGALYVKRPDVTGQLPLPRSPCELDQQ